MRIPARTAGLIAAVVALGTLAGCGGADDRGTTAPKNATTATPTVVPAPATTALPSIPPTTATTVGAPDFTTAVSAVTAADLGASWRDGCPVGPDQLRRVSVTHWDFDGRPQTGTLVVHADVVGAVQEAFRRLFAARVPIRRIEPVDRFGGSDDASMAADNTSAFNCRLAVTSGPAQWSVHAFGRAIDVNPVENPYVLGGAVLPPAGAAFTDRSDVRPGMAVAGGPLVDAFAAVGWQWGGRWTGSPDYQHFSADGG